MDIWNTQKIQSSLYAIESKAFCKLAESSSGRLRASLKIRLPKPHKTLPGPHSKNPDDRGSHRLVEGGPGKVLCGFGNRILSDARNLPLEDSASLQNALDSIA